MQSSGVVTLTEMRRTGRLLHLRETHEAIEGPVELHVIQHDLDRLIHACVFEVRVVLMALPRSAMRAMSGGHPGAKDAAMPMSNSIIIICRAALAAVARHREQQLRSSGDD
jgi:hypothetical protein